VDQVRHGTGHSLDGGQPGVPGNAQGQFVAYSADKGQKLWSFPAQSGIVAAPMTYAIGGEQYVAVMVGWGGVWDVATGILAHKGGASRNISRLLVFKLGASGTVLTAAAMPGRSIRRR
jgi:alcohol dehydrogenase (cytochrome c)/quinohemoprotein ethanol dehydrogenase